MEKKNNNNLLTLMFIEQKLLKIYFLIKFVDFLGKTFSQTTTYEIFLLTFLITLDESFKIPLLVSSNFILKGIINFSEVRDEKQASNKLFEMTKFDFMLKIFLFLTLFTCVPERGHNKKQLFKPQPPPSEFKLYNFQLMVYVKCFLGLKYFVAQICSSTYEGHTFNVLYM